MMRLKKLNTSLFPVRYNDKYYANALVSGEFTKLELVKEITSSTLTPNLDYWEGRERKGKERRGKLETYIKERGLFSTRLLNHVLDLCSKQNIMEIYLHVQTNNEDAINFYKKFGFEITETIKNYYTNIDPPDCFVIAKFTAPSQAKK
ncbi:hypothetical protein J1N35_022868 [Gossypium stocksii]|uniref:N-acetyltransferase domain-containing protein n=1 Tax=Gossypium stocksii TaxID=47602 RepID=A0A9D4A356_9ROSI|nr:hypothetical protein J1N35_022868 [Gossypium stocksii]